jgi:hypothetical protein
LLPINCKKKVGHSLAILISRRIFFQIPLNPILFACFLMDLTSYPGVLFSKFTQQQPAGGTGLPPEGEEEW